MVYHNRHGNTSSVMRACARYVYEKQTTSHPEGVHVKDIVAYARFGNGRYLRQSRMSLSARTLASILSARSDFTKNRRNKKDAATWTIDPKSKLLEPLSETTLDRKLRSD